MHGILTIGSRISLSLALAYPTFVLPALVAARLYAVDAEVVLDFLFGPQFGVRGTTAFVVLLVVATLVSVPLAALLLRLLGRVLGDTVREQAGQELFDRVERVRSLSKSFRAGSDVSIGAPVRLLSGDEHLLRFADFNQATYDPMPDGRFAAMHSAVDEPHRVLWIQDWRALIDDGR